MNRWIGLAAVIVCLFAYYLWSQDSTSSKTQSSNRSEAQPSASRETATVKPSAPKARPPVEILPGQSGKKAVRLRSVSQNIEDESRRRDDLISRYRVNSSIEEPFDRLRLRAVEKNRFEPSMGAEVGQLLGYVLVEASGPNAPLVTGDSLPVVSSKSNGRLGIVTGTIIVTLRDPERASALESSYGLELKYEDKPSRQAYFAANLGLPLDQLVEALTNDQGVESARLEIVQGKKKFQ